MKEEINVICALFHIGRETVLSHIIDIKVLKTRPMTINKKPLLQRLRFIKSIKNLPSYQIKTADFKYRVRVKLF